MKRKNALPELLAPAGSFECLEAAIAAGADAVYIGGKRFGARAYAENFDTGAISRAVTLCHLHGVKLYVTVNTLVYDREMEDVVEYARELYLLGVDALIVADLGAVREIRRAVPDLELHASTQMSVHNSIGAEEASRLGCSRVVLARELSYENICEITEKVTPEIEVFLHGALCVCHSGQCLFSSMVGGRSGNRGECAQPCRLPFSSTRGRGYPLSLKDLCLAEHIPELILSGVSSLKIEGRMKSAGYVYTVTSVYRRLLDENRRPNERERELLRRAFSRSGFTDGYYRAKLSAMTGIRSEEDKREGLEINSADLAVPRHRVFARVEILRGKAASMTLYDGTRSVTAFGDVPAEAESSPLTDFGVKERLSKMGNTFLELRAEDIELRLDGGLNLPPSSINALRRLAAERFEDFGRRVELPEYSYEAKRASKERLEDFGRRVELPEYTYGTRGASANGNKLVSAEFLSEETFLRAVGSCGSELDRIDFKFVPLFSSDGTVTAAGGVSLPPVIMEDELAEVRGRLCEVARLGIKNAMISNLGHISLVKEAGLVSFGGFRLNVTNHAADAFWSGLGVTGTVLSPELTLPMARDIGGGVITYGRIPLMLTERCFIKENFGCNECSKASLIDRRGERFPLLREYKHRNLILNSAVTYMGDKGEELSRCGIRHTHLIFTTERGEDILDALRASREQRPLSRVDSVRRVGRRKVGKKKR